MNPFTKAIDSGKEAAAEKERNWENEVKRSGWLDKATEMICDKLKNESLQGNTSVVVYWWELLDLAPNLFAVKLPSRLAVAAKLLHDHIEALNEDKFRVYFMWKDFKPTEWTQRSYITVMWDRDD
jgi:hypothetical protein